MEDGAAAKLQECLLVGQDTKDSRFSTWRTHRYLKVKSTSKWPRRIDVIIFTLIRLSKSNFDLESMGNRRKCVHWVKVLMANAHDIFAVDILYHKKCYSSYLTQMRKNDIVKKKLRS